MTVGGVSGRDISRGVLAAFFVSAGTLHFVKTGSYERMMPPYLPAHRELVYVSGVAEIAGGVGVLVPSLRRPAGWGLVALLVAVFPANVYMATNTQDIEGLDIPRWLLFVRLPLQALLIAWVISAVELRPERSRRLLRR